MSRLACLPRAINLSNGRLDERNLTEFFPERCAAPQGHESRSSAAGLSGAEGQEMIAAIEGWTGKGISLAAEKG